MPLIRKGGAEPPAPARDERGEALATLTDGTNDQRWAAARAAGEAPGGVQALGQALLTEMDPRVREAIFTSLMRTHSPEAVEAILPHLRSDDANLRTGALDALRGLAGTATPNLPTLLRDPDQDVRVLACEILRDLPSVEAKPLLCELLGRDEQVNVCAAAVEVLAEIGGPEALPALVACMARFPNEPCLIFSIKAAVARIGAQITAHRG